MNFLYVGGESYEFELGSNLLEIIQNNDLGMESPCGGKGLCGKCKVQIVNGTINELTNEELKFLSQEEIDNNIRLGCLVYPKGNLNIKLLKDKNTNHKILADGYMPEFIKKPVLTKNLYNIVQPTLQNNKSYETIIKDILGKDIQFNYETLKQLPKLFKEENFTAICLNVKLIGLECRDTKDSLYSVAVDIGTTTVVCSLIDINRQVELRCESEINPQKEYGLDVLSRINFIRSKENGLEILHKLIIDCINKLIKKLCETENIKTSNIYELAIAANSTMMHILLKVNPESIGKSPYATSFIASKNISAKELGIDISKFGNVYLLPGVSSYIGADIVSGVCVCDLKNTDKNILFIDIGTNGEMVLSKKGKLVSCSCAAGPALE